MNWESSSVQGEADASGISENSRQAEAILAGVTRLPTLPAVATRLLSMGVSEEVHFDEMIELIEADPALSARMLSLCRCADAGLGDRITTVRRAVIMLGLEAVRSAVLSVLVFDRMRVDHDELDHESLLDIEGFWTRSIATACVSERVAVIRGKSGVSGVSSDQAYLAGLVSGLGKLSLYKVLPKSWEKALVMAEVQHVSLSSAERATIGIDHHTAGKRLAEHWGLPESVRDVMWLHGQLPAGLPEQCNRELVSIVTLAGAWCEDRHIGWSGEVRAPVELDEIADELGFELSDLDSSSGEIIEQVSDRAKILGVGEFSAPELLLESLMRANSKLAAINDEMRGKQQIAERSHRMLAAVDTFYESIGDGVDPQRVVEAMVQSGATLTGIDLGMVVVQDEPGYPWFRYKVVNGQVVDDTEDQSGAAQRVESPAMSDAGEIRPGHIAGLSGDQVLDLASLGWFREMISTVREVGVASLIGVGDAGLVDIDDGLGDGSVGGVSCLVVLVKASSSAAPELSAKGFRVIARSWARSLTTAVHAKASRLLAEELVNTNRELSSMQREKTKNESLLRLGQMAAGAAHEMNNPLSVINGRAQQLFERLGGQRDRESVQAIASAADSLSSMITSMHLLAEPPVPALAGADPVLVVRQAIELAKAQSKNAGIRAKVKLSTVGEIEAINVDRDLIAKAICEPIINAINSNPIGVVTVSIEPAGSDGRVMVRIVDTGPGLSKRAQNHAFDPFFSELKAGRRPGLGLARSRSVIELHGGTITIANTPGKVSGAQVQITLQTKAKSRRRAA